MIQTNAWDESDQVAGKNSTRKQCKWRKSGEILPYFMETFEGRLASVDLIRGQVVRHLLESARYLIQILMGLLVKLVSSKLLRIMGKSFHSAKKAIVTMT